NNNPWNIVRMAASDHIRHHNSISYGTDFDPSEHSDAIKASLQRRATMPGWSDRMRAQQPRRARSFWHDARYAAPRQRLLDIHRQRWTESEREAQRQRQRAFWQDNESARTAQGDRSRRAWAESDDERRAAQAQRARQIRLRDNIDADSVRLAL